MFTPRNTAPTLDNKNYLKYPTYGFNKCIEIDAITHSVLPNCTGMAWGRWCEIFDTENTGTYPALSTGNATNWYGYTTDGYQRGNKPQLGAIACWSGGSDGLGHVGVVENIVSDTDWYMSESAYNSYYYRYTNIQNNYFGSNYTFLGFIYLPTEYIFDMWWLFKKKRKYYIM